MNFNLNNISYNFVVTFSLDCFFDLNMFEPHDILSNKTKLIRENKRSFGDS